MPLNDNMISANVFDGCTNLTTLNLVGGIHKVIASLHMESWRNEMREEINRINQDLSNTNEWGKTAGIQQWIRSAIGLFEHYKSQHKALLKEAQRYLNSLCGRPILMTTNALFWSRRELFEPRGVNGREQGKRFASHLVQVL